MAKHRHSSIDKSSRRSEINTGPDQGRMGQVIASFGAKASIEDDDGQLHHCHVMRHVHGVVCGDRVRWTPSSSGDAIVIERLHRDSLLERMERGRTKPIAANIDQIMVVMAILPTLNEGLIDRYLAVAAHQELSAHLVINKCDLLDGSQLESLQQHLANYQRIGYPVLYSSVISEHGLDTLRADLCGHTSLMVGPSGVGKSSLVKALLPDRDIRIGAISQASGTGKHTTTSAMLYHLSDGGDLIDSPGMSEFLPAKFPAEALADGFIEFRPFLGQCRFRNCQHDAEPGCALQAAAAAGQISPARLRSFLELRRALQEL